MKEIVIRKSKVNSPINITTILVDDQDYDRVIKHRWYIYNDRGYIQATTLDNKIIQLNRYIIGATDNRRLVYLDGNKLNNQRSNIGYSNEHPEVMRMNQRRKDGGYKGVGKPVKSLPNWLVRLQLTYPTYTFISEWYTCQHTAAYAYNKMVRKYLTDPVYTNDSVYQTPNDLSNSGFSEEELERKLIIDRVSKANRRVRNAREKQQGSGVYINNNKTNPLWIPIIMTDAEVYNLGGFKYKEHAEIVYKAIREHLEATGVEVLVI